MSELSEETFMELNKLCFKNGAMRQELDYAMAGFKCSENCFVVLARPTKAIVGWAIYRTSKRDSYTNVAVYIGPRHRRKGIGSRIVTRIKYFQPLLWSYPHDVASRKFFAKNQVRY